MDVCRLIRGKAICLLIFVVSACETNEGQLVLEGSEPSSSAAAVKVLNTSNNDWISSANQTSYEINGQCLGVNSICISSEDGLTPFTVPCNSGEWSTTIDLTTVDAATVDLKIDGLKGSAIKKSITYKLYKLFEPTRVDTKVGQVASGSADGVGTSAQFSNITGIASDGTHIYIADSGNRIIKKVNPKTLVTETVAGIVGVSGNTNGPALSSTFTNLRALTYHDGYLYISDYGTNQIRRLNLAANIVENFAGDGTAGTVDGIGTAARFSGPSGLVSDGTYIWVAERGNRVIRRITIATAQVILVAGQAGSAGSVDGIGPAARLHRPENLVSVGNYLYVTEDYKHHVRKIDKTTFEVTTYAGHPSTTGVTNGVGTAARFNGPIGISTDGEYLYIVEKFNRRIRKISISTEEVTFFAGTGAAGDLDEVLLSATLNNLFSSFYFSNRIYLTSGTMLRAIH